MKKMFNENWGNYFSNNNNNISLKTIHINDIWLVKFPYRENGNFYKIRPALVVGIDDIDDDIFVKKITSNPERGIPIDIDYRVKNFLKKGTFLTKDIAIVKDYMLLVKLGKRKFY